MSQAIKPSSGRALAVLHPVFALTGVLHTVGGAILPSLAAYFHLSDSASGLLFFLYFAGTSLGALLCRSRYARTMTAGFAAMAFTCFALAWSPRPLLGPVFLLLGIGVGAAMSSVTLFTGRYFPERCAPLLTFLNFSWSAGALVAPLIAARILMHHSYRAAYIVFAFASAAAAIACALVLRDGPEPVRSPGDSRTNTTALRLVVIFAFAAFLQVGIENTVAAWLPSYALRTAGKGMVLAAASSSFYWAGFLSSRGLSTLVLLRALPMRVFRFAVVLAFPSALLLGFAPSAGGRNVAMFLLGTALAPIYPLVLAGFFARAQQTSDSRWILFTAGFGGSVLPWIAGFVSTHTGSLQAGMLIIPAALLLMALLLPALGGADKAPASA
jgi:fucose permease